MLQIQGKSEIYQISAREVCGICVHNCFVVSVFHKRENNKIKE